MSGSGAMLGEIIGAEVTGARIEGVGVAPIAMEATKARMTTTNLNMTVTLNGV